MKGKPYIIALEEHYFDPEVKQHITGLDATMVPRIIERLDDVGELRLREMHEARIDMQVLSHANPGCRSSTPRPPSAWHAAPMTGFTRRFGHIPTGSLHSPQYLLPILSV